MKRIGFEALIKRVEVMSLVSGDKSVRITLQIDNPPDTLVAELDQLHRPDKNVGVAIAEMPK
jgi:hypothetical protein